MRKHTVPTIPKAPNSFSRRRQVVPAGRVAGLADLVNGRGANTLRMRLQSFVVADRLEQVAEVASRRLLDMSGGRYTFLHSDAQGRNGARGGLGLDVLDEYTGVRRPTKTLSGGESFKASLALALGLVGVISHVEELRTRIPTRVEVLAGRHGSRLAG